MRFGRLMLPSKFKIIIVIGTIRVSQYEPRVSSDMQLSVSGRKTRFVICIRDVVLP